MFEFILKLGFKLFEGGKDFVLFCQEMYEGESGVIVDEGEDVFGTSVSS